MSMQEPTDDQLDGLFRKSAEEFNTPFDPAAWQALKTRLDNHDRLTVWEHLLRWGLPVLLLLFLTGGSWNAYQRRAEDGQPSNRGIAMRQLAPVKDNPAPNGPGQPQQQRTEAAQRLPNETLTGNPAETAGAQSKGSKQPAFTGGATARATTALGRAVVSPTTEKRSNAAKPTATNAKIRPDDATTQAVSAYRTKPTRRVSTTSRIATAERPERTQLVAEPQDQASRSRKKRIQTGIAANLPATTNAIKATKSFTKRQVKGKTATEQSAELPFGLESQVTADVLPAHRFGLGA